MTEHRSGLVPPDWIKDVLTHLAQPRGRPFGIDPNNLPTNYTRHERKPSWLARRKQFAKDWKRMQKLGLKNEFLEHDFCFECGGELQVTIDTSYLVGTPNPDYIPPALLIGDSITIPYAKKETK